MVAVVAALVGGGTAAARSGLLTDASDHMPWSSRPPRCTSTQFTVLTAPEVAGIVQNLVQPLDGHSLPDGSCLRMSVQGQEPAQTVAAAPTTALSSLPQLWIPDASLWAGQAPSWSMHQVGSLASSPVVFAASRVTVARLGWTDGGVSWQQVLTPERTLLAPGMTDDAAALLGLLALARSLGGGDQAQQAIAGVVLAASRQHDADEASALDTARGNAKSSPVLLTSERVVAQADHDPATDGLVAVHPQGLPAVLDYPILRVDGPDDDIVTQSAADLALHALQSPAARAAVTAAGFQPPQPVAAQASSIGQAALKAVNDQVTAFVAEVRARATPSRLLALIDVSLSMQSPVRPGLSRSRLAVQAAIGAGRFLPDTSAIGLWSFAGKAADGKPYTEIAPVAGLGEPDQGHTHRDVVNAALAELPHRLVGGGTALYDATLAAVRKARGDYDQNANNAIVVFTDGTDDYPGGITLKQFVAAAKADAAAHPDQPISLIGIGIGPEADMASLTTMCNAVGGIAYRAENVEDLRTVLFDAIAKRTLLRLRAHS